MNITETTTVAQTTPTATTAPFDAAVYKSTTRAQWETAAEAWDRWSPTLEQWLDEATEMMLDGAGIGLGDRVIDIAAGAGGQTIAAARRVGSTGVVLATDISPTILEFALAAAGRAGFANVSIREVDGECLDVDGASFDAAISRLGLIYFPDRAAGLAEVLRVLRPGGRFSAVVYSTAAANGFFSIPVSVIREAAKLPPPVVGQPGPFSLGAPDAFAGALVSAGFVDVEVRTVSAPVLMATASECVRFECESFGALHQMLAGLDDDTQSSTWVEIADLLRQFETSSGFSGPCELLVGSGRKP